MDRQKCVIIGCGGVGATTAYTFMQSGLFNEIVLIDMKIEKAVGEALDIGHGIPFSKPAKIYQGSYEDVKGAYLIVIAAGANQGPGETRIDLGKKNVQIFSGIIPEVVKYNSDGILLVVTNPVDILTAYTLKTSGFPKERVIGSGTVLDTARLRYLLSERIHVDSRNIHAFIVGEHGDSELAVWSSASVAGIPLEDYCRYTGCCSEDLHLQEIYEDVRDSAYEIINRKGATYYAVAMAVRRIAEALIRDERSVLPVSNYACGHYGLGEICIGLPAIVGEGGIEDLFEIPMNEKERKLLEESANKLEEAMKNILA